MNAVMCIGLLMRMGADPNASSPQGTAMKMARTAPTKNLLRGLPTTPSTRRLLSVSAPSSLPSSRKSAVVENSNNNSSGSINGRDNSGSSSSLVIEASGESQVHYQAELDSSDASDTDEYDGDDENSSTEERDGVMWREAFTNTGQRYYFNMATGEAVWEKPAKQQQQPQQQQQKAKSSNNNNDDNSPLWVECFTDDGTKFFYNPTTNQSVWELPENG